MSFMTLGIFWNGQQTQLNHFARGNRDIAWIHLAFLACITFMPFSTQLLADFSPIAPRCWCTGSIFFLLGYCFT